jgi:hypothetical protein
MVVETEIRPKSCWTAGDERNAAMYQPSSSLSARRKFDLLLKYGTVVRSSLG